MSRPVTYLHQELPGYVLQRRAWIHEMETQARDDERASMEMLAYVVMLAIICTFCVVAWVLW